MKNIFHDIHEKIFFLLEYGIPDVFNNTSGISRHELKALSLVSRIYNGNSNITIPQLPLQFL